MYKIIIISSSVRIGRNSHRVALFFKNFIVENNLATVEILDLEECKFPIFGERLRSLKDPPQKALHAAGMISGADGVIIVTPEYNGGYPASLKNFIDLLVDEWRRKPIAVATASTGQFGATQVITSLVFSLWKIGACVVPASFSVPKVEDAYDIKGVPTEMILTNNLSKRFVSELFWYIEASKRMSVAV